MADTASHIFERSLDLNGSDCHYELVVDPTWEAQPGTVFGGFTLAVLLRAAGLECATGRPVSLSCHFLRPLSTDEPLEIEVTPLRRGRSSDLLRVSLYQAGKAGVESLIRTTNASIGPTVESPRDVGDPYSLPLAIELEVEDGWERHVPWYDHIEVRGGWDRSGTDEIVWTRFRNQPLRRDDPFLEAARFALVLDQQAPTIMSRLGYIWGPKRKEIPWGFSNLDMLAHFHRSEGTEWLYSVSTVSGGRDGIAGGRTEIWSQSGELLATGMSQVAFFPSTGVQLFG